MSCRNIILLLLSIQAVTCFAMETKHIFELGTNSSSESVFELNSLEIIPAEQFFSLNQNEKKRSVEYNDGLPQEKRIKLADFANIISLPKELCEFESEHNPYGTFLFSTKNTEFLCEYGNCKKTFAHIKDLQSHRSEHMKLKKIKLNECPWRSCNHIFTSDLSPYKKKEHILFHFFQFFCERCKKNLRSIHSLRIHEEEVHKIEHGKKYYCSPCSQYFKYKLSFKKHKCGIRKNLICLVMKENLSKLCGKKCSTLYELYEHLLEHCETYQSRGDCMWSGCSIENCFYKKHLPLHSGYKPFVCECGRRFADVYNMVNNHTCLYKNKNKNNIDKKLPYKDQLIKTKHAVIDLVCHWLVDGKECGKECCSIQEHYDHTFKEHYALWKKGKMVKRNRVLCPIKGCSMLATHIKSHLNQHTYLGDKKCKNCNQGFRTVKLLASHNRECRENMLLTKALLELL